MNIGDVRVRGYGDRGGRFALVHSLNDKGESFLQAQLDYESAEWNRGFLVVELDRVRAICSNALAAGVSVILDVRP